MSPILDPQGNPLPSTRATPSVLDQMCNSRDANNAWPQVMERYDLLLQELEPAAGPMLDLLSGRGQLDATTPDGQRLIRLAIDNALMSLLLRRHAQRLAAKEADALDQNGGQLERPQ